MLIACNPIMTTIMYVIINSVLEKWPDIYAKAKLLF